MSDIYGRPTRDPYGVSSRDPYSGQGVQRQGLTDAQRQLKPYIEKEKEKKEKQWAGVGALAMVFDILQTGNYMSAGMADAIWKSVKNNEPFPDTVKKAVKGAWDGLTWKDKKIYSDVIRGNLDSERLASLDKQISVAGMETGISPVSVMGFFADVLLDPTTYVMPFKSGLTSGAVSTAREAAEDALKIAAKSLDQPTLAKLDKLGITQGILKTAFEKNDREILGKLKTALGDEYVRYMDDVYKKAYREALVTPGEKLRDKYARQIAETEGRRGGNLPAVVRQQEPFSYSVPATLRRNVPLEKPGQLALFPEFSFGKAGTEAAEEKILNMSSTLQNLSEKMAKDTTYAQAGERSIRVLGLELPGSRKVREPWFVERTWNKLQNYYENSGVGDTFGNAWYRIMNNGPMKALKEVFGIRSPYERIIRNKELEYMSEMSMMMSNKMGTVKKIVGELTDKEKKSMRQMYDMAEVAKVRNGLKKPIYEIIEDGLNNLEMNGTIKGFIDDKGRFLKAVADKETLDRSNMRTLKMLEAEGLITAAPDEYLYYLRSYYKDMPKGRAGIGGSAPPLNKQRQFMRAEVMQQDIGRLKSIYGVDDETAKRIVNDMGGFSFSTDLEESLMVREVIQAKIEAKANLLRQMKEFGVDVRGLGLGQALENDLMAQAREKGIDAMQSSLPAFDGLLFDRSIKGVVERIVTSVQNESLESLRGAWSTFNSWWKGTALMAPATKVRNFVDNNMTGFIKHGFRWFDIKKYDMPALMATVYASRKGDPMKALKEFGMTEGFAKNILNSTWYSDGIKNYTVRDMADMARKYGVFSERTMGYDIGSTVKKMMGTEKEGILKKAAFVGHKTSHAVDEILENSARIKSFLMDFEDITRTMPKGSDVTSALEYAAREARKWFVDYNDLSDKEKKWLRNVIPFYSFIRKNVANKLHSIIMHPDTLSVFPKFIEMIQLDDPDFNPDLIPAYMKNLGMFPALKIGEGEFGMMNTGLSVQNLNLLPLVFEEGSFLPQFSGEELRDSIISSAHPILKTAIEMIPEKGYDTFRKRDLDSTAKAPFLMRFLVNHPMPLAFMDGIMRKIGFEDGLKATVDEDGKLQIDAKMARILESNLPVLRHLDMYAITGTEALEALVPGFQKVMEEDFAMKSDYEGLEKTFQILAYWTGLKFKENDVEEMKKQLSRDIYYSAQKRRVDDMKLTEAHNRRRADYRKREDRKIRRLVR